MSVCLCSQTAGRNSCSIVSGDVSNCSYRLTVHPVASSRLSRAYNFFHTRKTSKTGPPAPVFISITVGRRPTEEFLPYNNVCNFKIKHTNSKLCRLCIRYKIPELIKGNYFPKIVLEKMYTHALLFRIH